MDDIAALFISVVAYYWEKYRLMGLVRELQQDSLDRQVPVSDLLRKALVVAHKLGLPDFEEWVSAELNGYGSQDNERVPEYRHVTAQVKALNPCRGWQPAVCPEADMARNLSLVVIVQSVGEIETLLRPGRDKAGSLEVPFDPEMQSRLFRAIQPHMEVTRFVNPAQIFGIVDRVRNTILNWSLKLEDDGILGDSLSFSDEERNIATGAHYNINNFYGTASNVQIQQDSPGSTMAGVTAEQVDQLRDWINKLKTQSDVISLSDTDKAELAAEIASAEAQIASPKPKKPVLRSCLESFQRILEGVTSDVVAQQLLSNLPVIIQWFK